MSNECVTVRSIFHIMDFTVKENLPGVLIFIDFKKAFDSLEWNYLLKCFEYFNFAPKLILWVDILQEHAKLCYK